MAELRDVAVDGSPRFPLGQMLADTVCDINPAERLTPTEGRVTAA
jgi:hypothetical protein